MTVLEQAKILGETIRQSEPLVQYFAAKRAFESNAELQGKLFEYETQRKILAEEFSKDTDTQSPALISAIRDRLSVLGAEITADHTYREHEDAKVAVNELMNQVNSEISLYVFGRRPASECTHDCSTCSGCGDRS